MPLTGKRAERKEFYQTLRGARAITRAEYTTLIAGLEKEEEKAQRRAEAAMMRRETVRIAKLVAAPPAVRSGVLLDIQTEAVAPGDAVRINALTERALGAAEQLVGVTNAYIQITHGRSIFRSAIMDLDPTLNDPTEILYKHLYRYLQIRGSDEAMSVFAYTLSRKGDPVVLRAGTHVRVVITTATALPPKRIVQSFRDGLLEHCVFAPLKVKVCELMRDVADSTAKKWGQRLKRLEGYEKEFAAGVPEDQMETIASALSMRIHLYDLLNNRIKTYNENAKNAVSFTNTRENHVEMGHLVLDQTAVRTTLEELRVIVQQHKDDGIFYFFDGDIRDDVPRFLSSMRGAWRVYGDDYDIFNAFDESIGIKHYAVDAVRRADLNRFLRQAQLINAVPIELCATPNELEGVSQIDMTKAYTHHRSAPFYRGFPKGITYFGKVTTSDPATFLSRYVGTYQFRCVACPAWCARDFQVGSVYLRESVEIEYYMSRGLVVELIAGAFAHDVFHFDYTPEMLEEGRYRTWAGKKGIDRPEQTYMFPASAEWAQHLKAELGEHKVRYYQASGLASIRQTRSTNYTYHHILGFITAYTRINMLEIMRRIPSENLVKVILDGVYFRGSMPSTHVPVKDKTHENKTHRAYHTSWYKPFEEKTFDDLPVIDPRFFIPAGMEQNVMALTGQGGSGKSYSVLCDTIFPGIIYVTFMNSLGKEKKDEFGLPYYKTIHRLIGEKCTPFKSDPGFRCPSVFLLDEITMYEAGWIEKAREMYPDALFLLAGDVDRKQWFQCRSGTHIVGFNKVWLPSENQHVVDFLNDMRAAKSPLLMDMKLRIREEMRRVFGSSDSDFGSVKDARRMSEFAIKHYRTVSFHEGMSMFREGDIWIAGTRARNEILMKKGIFSKAKTDTEEGVGSHTTHGFQGKTVDTKRTFVSLDFFEYAMLYSAISRVRSFEQLVLVRKY